MITGYRIGVTCPHCGGVLEQVASGTSNGTETQAVVRCTKRGCGEPDWLITVIARSLTARRHADNEIAGLPPWCGSATGLTKHHQRGEPACDDCLAANARKAARYRQKARRSV